MLRVERSGTRSLKTSGLAFCLNRMPAPPRASQWNWLSPLKFQFIEAAMTTKHSEAFIEQALLKAFSRGGRTIKTVAEDLNINHHTIKYWMKNKAVSKNGVPVSRGQRHPHRMAERQ